MNWLIIQGCPRSGTTMLMNLINTHPEILITHELDLNQFTKEKLKSKLVNEKKLKYFGDKVPEYYYSDIYKKIENIKVIHILRNPVNTINSILERTKNAKLNIDRSWSQLYNLDHSLISWIDAWNFASRSKTNPNHLNLKYEEIIANPEKEIEKISNFLKVDPRFNKGVIREIKKPINLSEKEMEIINTHLKDIIEDWNLPIEEIIDKYPKKGNLRYSVIRRRFRKFRERLNNENRNIP